MVAKNSSCKPFQKLLFLVRDWNVAFEYAFGSEGGSQYLQKCFENSKDEHESLRNHIRDCFEDINCHLMPHPGLKVSESENFAGHWNYIRPAFKASGS